MSKTKCTIYKTYCFEHDFAHGAEAEELRSGIEKIAAREYDDADEVIARLLKLLDKVDARDSLAFREGEKDARGEVKSP